LSAAWGWNALGGGFIFGREDNMAFQLISVAAFAAFYGCYFVKMLRQKRRGIQTDQLGKGKAGFAKFVEITMKAAAVLAFAAGLISIFTGTGRSPAAVRAAGAAMSVGGTIVFIFAVRAMGDSWRAGVSKTDQTELVTDGIYQISRNPAFLGFDLLYMGTLLMFFNGILCTLTVFAVIMYHMQIVCVEEKFLVAAFGEEYLHYQKKVCRYLGRKR
jgi:protein-S-isoprenylcysteine O-methyltransferase Ste14